MRYIYNRIITGRETEFEHQGIVYSLSGKNHMGTIDYYTYTRAGHEPILVIPTFAIQFKEVADSYEKIKDVHTDKAIRIRLKAMFGRNPSVENFDSEDEKKYTYSIKYKEIEVYMFLDNGEFKLSRYFRILSKKILDNKENINAGASPDFEQYFGA